MHVSTSQYIIKVFFYPPSITSIYYQYAQFNSQLEHSESTLQ